MARALWSGSLSFGLVSVPVKLFRATSTATAAHSISFHQIHRACGSRLAHVRRCPTCEVDVPWEDVVKGYEYSRDRYALVETEELPAASREEKAAIAVIDFVPAAEVDPMYFDRSYWMAPDGPGAAKAYGLLFHALHEEGRLAISRVMLRTRSQLAAVRTHGSHLIMDTMFFQDELVSEEEIPPGVAGRPRPTERELKLARDLVEKMTTHFDPSRYKDEYTSQVRALLADKIAKQEDVTAPGPVRVGGKVIDLMDALRKSLAEGTAKGAAKSAAKGAVARARRRRAGSGAARPHRKHRTAK